MSARKILQYDSNMNFIKEFESQKEASIQTGISVGRIKYARQNNKIVDGYYFLYKNKEEQSYYVKTTCMNCGIEFNCQRYRLENNKHIFCGQKCHGEYIRNNNEKNCTCKICGKMFHRKQSAIEHNKSNVCSKECLKELQKLNMTGQNNHQFGLKGYLNSSWKSDERISHYGYRLIRCVDHPLRDSHGFVFEHRLVAEQYLLTNENSVEIDGKLYLSKEFHVHHIDFDKLNNKVDNLYVLPKSIHIKFHNSLKEIIRNDKDGKIISVNKKIYTKEELRILFFDFLKKQKV